MRTRRVTIAIRMRSLPFKRWSSLLSFKHSLWLVKSNLLGLDPILLQSPHQRNKDTCIGRIALADCHLIGPLSMPLETYLILWTSQRSRPVNHNAYRMFIVQPVTARKYQGHSATSYRYRWLSGRRLITQTSFRKCVNQRRFSWFTD